VARRGVRFGFETKRSRKKMNAMTARGKVRSGVGRTTEAMAPVAVATEFKASHRCRSMPRAMQVIQIPPQGWQLRGPGHLVVGVAVCPWCGLALPLSSDASGAL
jgi:hypothetical protein